MKAKQTSLPVFKTESEEADWWASIEQGERLKGSPLVAGLNKSRSVQIALRLPETDLAMARRVATRKGIGYQTLLKMLVHEGLEREARRH